jgi:hypothetical protein
MEHKLPIPGINDQIGHHESPPLSKLILWMIMIFYYHKIKAIQKIKFKKNCSPSDQGIFEKPLTIKRLFR